MTCGFLFVSRRQGAFSPVRMFLYGWLIVLGTTVGGMIVYERPFDVTTFVLVLGTLVAFVVGAYIGRRPAPPSDRPFGEMRDGVDRATFTVLCLLAAAGTVVVAGELLSGGSQMLANFATESARVRNDYWSDFAANRVESNPVRSYGVAACLAVATLLPYASRYKRRGLQITALVAAATVVVSSLLSAARFSLGVLALCLLVSAALVYGAGSVRRVLTVPRLIIAGVIGFYFFVVFPTQRNPDLARAVERAVAYSGDAHIAEWVTDQDMSWLNVFAYSTGYFSTALDKLNYFVAATDVFEWNLLGGYNMPQFAPGVWHQARLNIADIMGREGWSLNPWSTGIRDLGIDFGMGLILVVAVLGFISQLVYDKAMASRSYIGLIAATYVSVSCLIFAFISPFQIRIVTGGLWAMAAFALAHWILTSSRKLQPEVPRSLNDPLSLQISDKRDQ